MKNIIKEINKQEKPAGLKFGSGSETTFIYMQQATVP